MADETLTEEPGEPESPSTATVGGVADQDNGGLPTTAPSAPSAPVAPSPSAPVEPVQDSGEVTMHLWRGDASGGDFQTYELPAQEGEVVLDVIHRVQAALAPDLACRWNCKAGKCGSCSAEINGKPSLMCMTRMDTLPEGEAVTVAPLKTFPVLRDLVTDVSFNYEVAKRIPPFAPRAKTEDEVEAGGYRMQQMDVERSQEFRKCIECFLCQDVCHVIRDHEDNKTSYAGPRFFIRSAELEMHPLDTNDRRQLLQQEQGLGKCNITKCCTEVCPEHIKITDNAIIPLKERVVDAKYDPVAWLGRKIGRRTKRSAAEAAASAPAQGPAAIEPGTVEAEALEADRVEPVENALAD
jgi:succinate dehydrogenase / fumarate reductase iron-sulfur subunit